MTEVATIREAKRYVRDIQSPLTRMFFAKTSTDEQRELAHCLSMAAIHIEHDLAVCQRDAETDKVPIEDWLGHDIGCLEHATSRLCPDTPKWKLPFKVRDMWGSN